MKKLLGATAASAIAAAMFAGAASADNRVYWNVYKDKDITITVDTHKTFDVDVEVDLYKDADGSAQATALVNSVIDYNHVDGGDFYGHYINRSARMDGSMNENRGIGQVNQDTGNFSNQGNVAAAAWNKAGSDVTMAEAYAEQNTTNNFSFHSDEFTPNEPQIYAVLAGSLMYNTGVYHLNQNAGNGNAQHNVLALALGSDSAVALSDSGLAQDNIGNAISEWTSIKDDTIIDSVIGNTGIVNVNQASGNMNNQATVYSVAALSSVVGLD